MDRYGEALTSVPVQVPQFRAQDPARVDRQANNPRQGRSKATHALVGENDSWHDHSVIDVDSPADQTSPASYSTGR